MNFEKLIGQSGLYPGATILETDPATGVALIMTATGQQVTVIYNAATGTWAPQGAAPPPAGTPTAPAPTTGGAPLAQGALTQSSAIGLNEDARQFDNTLASTNYRFGADLAEGARTADNALASGDYRTAAQIAEDARQANNALTSGDWRFGTDLAEGARTTDNALNATNWRFGEGLQEDARQFNVGETGTNDRARLQAALGGFQSVNSLAPQLGQLALQNAQFTAQMTQNPADFVARAFFQRGGESPLPVVSQADLINQLTNNISQYNGVLSGFNTNPLTNPQFQDPSTYGSYTNPVSLTQSPYGAYTAPTAPTYAPTSPYAPPTYSPYAAPTAPTGTTYTPQAGATGTAPLAGTALTGGTLAGATAPRLPTAPTTTTTRPPTTGGTTPSYLSPLGDPWSAEAINRWNEGILTDSIDVVTRAEDTAQHQADLAATGLSGWEAVAQDYANRGYDIPGYAFGSGMTRAPMMMTGDSPSGAPTGSEELILNPDRAPLAVVPNPNNQMGLQTTPPMSFGGPGGGNMPAPSFNQMPPLPAQASPQATLSRFGGGDRGLTRRPMGFSLPSQASSMASMGGSAIPRYADGTDWATDLGIPPVPSNEAGTVSAGTNTAVTNNLSSPSAFYQTPPTTTSIGMNFGAPQLPTQPQVTQQQLIDYARAYSPPAVSSIINGTTPETLRFGFPLPNPQQLSTLTPAEREALNTRLAVEFNTSIDDIEHAMRLRFTNARQRPRGTYAVGR